MVIKIEIYIYICVCVYIYMCVYIYIFVSRTDRICLEIIVVLQGRTKRKLKTIPTLL